MAIAMFMADIDSKKSHPRTLNLKKWAFLTLSFLSVWSVLNFYKVRPMPFSNLGKEYSPRCPSSPKFEIKEHEQIQYILHDDSFRNKSAKVFGGSIQIDTVVYDVMPDYSKFAKFHAYLEKNFPLVYKTAKVHKVNKYGLIFEFAGKNPDLKPVMLTAHQDTVPIGDPSDWTEDPFSGRYDGKLIHGRGASDCKNLLIGLMEAMEKFIEDGKDDFERGVLLAFGFDEEKSGFDGARKIGEYLVDYLGKDSIFFIVDEGPSMCAETMGDYYGLVITGEKGYIDLVVNIVTPGGHSSLPKDHTSIGMMSYFLTSYEDEMYESVLSDENPLLSTFECAAEQGHLPKELKALALSARDSGVAREKLIEYIDQDLLLKYDIRTSQAIDIVHGGDKANSLPRNVTAYINHRIAYGNEVHTVFDKAFKYAKLTAKKYGIGLTFRGKTIIPKTENGLMVVDYFGELLSPAPITPTKGDAWNTLTGHMRAFYEEEVYPGKFHPGSEKSYIVAPSVMTPNTDTRHYWNLTDNIFKSVPGVSNVFEFRPHGPDECIDMDSHLNIVAFYYNFFASALK